MILSTALARELGIDAFDPFDPTTWDAPSAGPCYLQLSDRVDIHAIVDPEDYAWARAHLWCHTYGSGQFAEVAEGVFAIERPDHIYARRCTGGRTLWLHREILTRAEGPPGSPRLIGDHRNGKTLDCRRKNLRWATPSQNARNIAGSRTRARQLKLVEAACR